MQPPITLSIVVLVAFAAGFLAGFIAGVRAAKKNEKMKAAKALAWGIAFLWMGFHIYSLLTTGDRVATVFDVMGAAAVGNILGFDVEQIIDKVARKK